MSIIYMKMLYIDETHIHPITTLTQPNNKQTEILAYLEGIARKRHLVPPEEEAAEEAEEGKDI